MFQVPRPPQMATPRITFVGGKMLSSTVKETNGKAEVPQKVYPPSAAPPTIPPDVAPAPPTSTASPAPPDTGPSTEAGEDSSSDPEPVGAAPPALGLALGSPC